MEKRAIDVIFDMIGIVGLISCLAIVFLFFRGCSHPVESNELFEMRQCMAVWTESS